MNVDKPYTPEALCDRKMLVPIYQRLFVWDEDRIRKLLDDLLSASKNTEAPYYVGIITVHEKDSAWEIVDGQQRLTFLTLLGCALKQNKPISEWYGGSKTWADFVFLSEGGEAKKNRISYVGRKGDEKVIWEWWDNSNGFDPAKLSGSFRIFYNVFEKFVRDSFKPNPGDSDPTLLEFGEYCFKKVSFLVNCLPEEYGPFDLNLYFEKMNSTGKQLEPIDVVKGRWFSEPDYVGKFNMCMNFDKTYAAQAENYQVVNQSVAEITLDEIVSGVSGAVVDCMHDDATDQSSLENRLPMKPEVLLLHALKLSLGCWKQCRQESAAAQEKVSFESKSLIKTFSEAFKEFSDDDKALFKQCFINELIAYRNWIDKNIIYLKGVGQSYDYEFRDKEGNAKDGIPTPEQQFQAMLYVASGDAQEWVLDAYKNCHCSQGKKLTLDVLRKCGVVSKHNPTIIDATDKLAYHVVDRYWFWRLDYELWSIVKDVKDNEDISYKIGVQLDDRMKDAILHYRFRRNISIEHLHPQSIAGTVKEGDDWGMRDNRDSAMHQFGNLAMMSVEGNSAQSNDGIGTKFGRVRDWIASGRLESIKMLVMFKLAEGNENGWTTELAKGHCEKMMGILGCATPEMKEEHSR